MKPVRQQASLRHLTFALLTVLTVLIMSIVGYILIEHISFIDALYTTVNMMSTEGNAAPPLTSQGRLFSIVVIVLGVGSLFYTFGASMEYMIEGHLSRDIGRRIMDRKIAALRTHSIICGFGRVGSRIASELAAANEQFVVIDENEDSAQRSIDMGYLTLQGNAASDDVLREAGILHAKTLLVATENDANNIFITLSARNLKRDLFIVARANHDETETKLKLAGASRVLSPYAISGHRMANLAMQPAVVDFFDTLINAEHPEFAVEEVPLSARSPLVGKNIREAYGHLEDGTMLLGLKTSKGIVIGSHQETRIAAGDAAIVIGTPKQIAAFARRMEGI